MKGRFPPVVAQLFFPGTLRGQLVSRSLFILAGILLVVGVVQYLFLQQFLYRNKAESIQSQISSIPKVFWEFYSEHVPRSSEQRRVRPMLFFPDASVAFVSGSGNFHVLLQNPDANAVVPMAESVYKEAVEQARRGKPYFTVMRDDRGQSQLIVLEPIRLKGELGEQTIGIAQVSLDTGPLKEELFSQLLLFLALSIIALLLGLLAFSPIVRRTLSPLSRMIATVERIDSEKLNERLPLSGTSEIDRLSVSFNRMMERLETSFEAEREAKERMRRFIADASHELRTPLTSIHGFLEVLLRGAASKPEQLENALRSMYNESGRLNKLVQDLLLLARLDQTPEPRLEKGNLSTLVREMEEQLRLLAGERTVQFQLEHTPDMLFDQDKMKQVILNLFQNAVQHTEPSPMGTIAVALQTETGNVRFTVRDNGAGMDHEHVQHIFDRFYRIDHSRSRIQGGAGLGLAITKTIVHLHGGQIFVTSSPGAGSEFTVLLPLERND